MEHLGSKIEVAGLWIEDIVLCRESRYFEDIVKFLNFRLRMTDNFFQVWAPEARYLNN